MAVREFAADPQSPSAARSFAKQTLNELLGSAPSVFRDDVELVVSELVTNALRAGSPSVKLDLLLVGPRRIAVHVTDEAVGWPHPREAGVHDIGGRGLALVSAVSTEWGVTMNDSTKTVWAELAVPD